MSKRETPPSPYSEATVVQSRNTPPPPPAAENGERTVVQGRSNLKETFDARTVVRPRGGGDFPPEMPAPPKAEAPKIPDVPKFQEPAKVAAPAKAAPAPTAVAAPVSAPVSGSVPTSNPASNSVANATPSYNSFGSTSAAYVEPTGGAVQVRAAEAEEVPKKTAKKEKVPREPRKPLDQRSKLMIAGVAVVVVLALVFFMGGGMESNPSAPQPQQQADAQPQTSGEQNLASEQPNAAGTGAPKFQQLSGPPATTTAEVLNRFDKASARAQERVEQYSRSGSGF